MLKERHWSLRQAYIHTGISTSVIHNMTAGIAPRAETIAAWAQAIGEDEADWLAWAGYRFVRGAPGTAQEAASAPESAIGATVAHLTREAALRALSEDERQALAWYDGLPPDGRETARAVLETLYRRFIEKEVREG